ncbi:uncharacterized protein LOC111883364 [Lactuca sativa]|uniref:uncharacterized protein LOC111883364 n=1 Tax=Lactuca sativa TaxID=4236 RepID=UPI000CD89B4F|nr:uncharacterized protein LOC111883364 [Lactuca sativa]
MSLHKFYKKKEDGEQQHKYKKVDLNALPVYPFEQPSIEFYHVNQRDEIRKAYLQKGHFQPLNHKFPPRNFGGKPRRFIQSRFDDNKYWFLLRQGLAFRGHNEKEDSDNKVLVDESRDVSCKEQMALVLRFVNKKGEVVERFVGIRNVNDTLALSLKATIHDMLSKWNLSPSRIRGQGYDGASNMSGAFNGLKTLIMNETKSTHFVHCFAHQLQLALVFVAKNHTTVNDFFDVVSRLLNIIGSSYKRRDKLRKKNKQIKLWQHWLKVCEFESGTGLNQEVDIKRPSDTRWGSHFASLLNIQTIYASICDVLEDLDHLNAILQRKDQDIVNAMNQVNNLHHYQVDVFKEVIDMQLQELNHHFNEVNTNLLLSIACLCPTESFKAFDLDKIMKMATLYPEEFPTEYDLRVLEVELGNYIKDVREDERFNDLKSIGDLAKKMVQEKKHIIFPKIYLLVKLALILPVATASVERAFSAMKLIKTDIHNKMSDQFLSDGLVSYIGKNVLKGIGNDTIVKMFQDIRHHRVQF